MFVETSSDKKIAEIAGIKPSSFFSVAVNGVLQPKELVRVTGCQDQQNDVVHILT
jgi:hypothetical protein